jgi:hypothetical protein
MRTVLTACLLLTACVCWADPAVTLQLAGVNGNYTWNGVYAYPYSVSVDANPAMSMMCDDYTDEIRQGESWTAKAWSLTQANVGSIYSSEFYYPSVFADPQRAFKAYEKAAYLLVDADTHMSDTNRVAADNAAVWYLFDPDLALSAPNALASEQLGKAATATALHPDYSYITVYTPTQWDSGLGRPQEFLAINGPIPPVSDNATPEPPASLLLAAGGGVMAALGAIRRARASRS